MKRFLSLLVVFFIAGNSFCQPLSFYRESLNFELDSSRFYISGMYFIRNLTNQDQSTGIYYPYIYETEIIDSISVYHCNTMQFIEPLPGKKGHQFNITIPASDSIILHIKYNHLHNQKDVTYILSTTKFWNHPFQMADYTLRIKEEVCIDKLFLPSDSTWKDNQYRYYFWKRYNYMPVSDFVVHFHLNK